MALLCHLGADWTLHSHLKSNDLLLWNVENCFTFDDVSARVHTTVIRCVVPHFQLVERGSIVLHPVKHGVETGLLFDCHIDLVVSIILFLNLPTQRK